MRYALCVLVLSATAACFSGEDKSPVPDKAAVAEAEKTIHEMFKADYAKPAPADRAALVDKLLSQGIEEQKDLASKYVLLRDARDIAAALGDATKAVKAVTEMAKVFALDILAEKGAALAKAETAARTPDAAEQLARQYAELADEAIAGDKHDIALKALAKANVAAQTAKNVPLVNELKDKGQKAQSLQREYVAASTALKTLTDKPDDPAANLTVGKYICFFKEAWDVGLPYLAKGSDNALKVLADKELAKPDKPEDQAALADEWWAVGEKQQGTAKLGCMGRSCHWYEQAGPKLAGLQRTKAIMQVDAYNKAVGRVRMNPVLTPEEQIKSLVEKLKAVNPAWDGKFQHKILGGRIAELNFDSARIQNIGPLAGLSVEFLGLVHTKVYDLRPLAGARISRLDLGDTLVRDLSHLRGSGVKWLCFRCNQPADFSPLKDSLETLLLGGTSIVDLSSVARLSLKELEIENCPITDVSALRGMALERIRLTPKRISKGWDVLRNMRTLMSIQADEPNNVGPPPPAMPTDEFWKKFDAGEFKGGAGKPDRPDKKTK